MLVLILAKVDRRLIVRAGLFVALLAMLLTLLHRLPADPLQVSYISAIVDKHRLLGERQESAIVLLGGSGTAFGFDSERLGEMIGRPVINAGLHAGLSADWMLCDVEPRLRQGDTVWLSLEYELMSHQKAIGSQELAALILDVQHDAGGSGAIGCFSWIQRIALLDDFAIYIGKKTVLAASRVINQWLGRDVSYDGLRIYHRDGFNSHGDVTSHWGREPLPLPTSAALDPNDIDERRIERLVQFRDRLRKRRIELVMLPPALAADSYDASRPFIEKLASRLRQSGVGYAVPPAAMRFDRRLFFDTPHHMTRQGAWRRQSLIWRSLQSDPAFPARR